MSKGVKLKQAVRCAKCRRSFEVDVSQSKNPFEPIGKNWTCGKPDCAEVAKQPRDKYSRPIAIHSAPFETTIKPTKHRNQPTTVDGIRFASKKEATRYAELRLMEKAGEIRELELQKRFRLDVNGEHICTFVADFAYVQLVGGSAFGPLPIRTVVEDVKGRKSTKDVAYRLFTAKKRLMKAVLGIEVVEV